MVTTLGIIVIEPRIKFELQIFIGIVEGAVFPEKALLESPMETLDLAVVLRGIWFIDNYLDAQRMTEVQEPLGTVAIVGSDPLDAERRMAD